MPPRNFGTTEETDYKLNSTYIGGVDVHEQPWKIKNNAIKLNSKYMDGTAIHEQPVTNCTVAFD